MRRAKSVTDSGKSPRRCSTRDSCASSAGVYSWFKRACSLSPISLRESTPRATFDLTVRPRSADTWRRRSSAVEVSVLAEG